MTSHTVELPAASVEPAARGIAERRKIVSALLYLLGGLFVLVAGGLMFGARPDRLQVAGGASFWMVVLFGSARWFQVRARRVLAAGRLAATDPTYSWHLTDRLIVAIDGQGAPRTDLSFKISAAQRAMLTAVPRARVVPPQ